MADLVNVGVYTWTLDDGTELVQLWVDGDLVSFESREAV